MPRFHAPAPLKAGLITAMLGLPLCGQEAPQFYAGILAGTMNPTTVPRPQGQPGSFEPRAMPLILGLRQGPWWGLQVNMHGFRWDADGSLIVAGTAWLSLGRSLSIYGLAGADLFNANQWDASGVSPCFGAGLHLDLTDHVKLKAEGSVSTNVFEKRVTRLGVGVAFGF